MTLMYLGILALVIIAVLGLIKLLDVGGAVFGLALKMGLILFVVAVVVFLVGHFL